MKRIILFFLAYKMDGTLLWSINLGKNIREGAHYTQFLVYDFDGDWREEVILRTTDNKSLRIFTTNIPTKHRFVTLMQDPIYRLSVAWQNVAYNQPPHPGFYMGNEMSELVKPNLKLVKYKSSQGDLKNYKE